MQRAAFGLDVSWIKRANGCKKTCSMDTQITELLQRVREGDADASHELMPLVYSELRRIAGKYLRRERKDHTLQPTALVNEVYLRMFGDAAPNVADKAHFLAIASQMMRRILVDYARARGSEKRGGDLHRVETPGFEEGKDEPRFLPLLELDRAIDALGAENPVLAQAIEMRYFGGLTAEEAAEVTGRSVHSVRHDLRFAQAWLRRALAGEQTS
jgi:RNA polymerase sigma factor (TIGR02999 family)